MPASPNGRTMWATVSHANNARPPKSPASRILFAMVKKTNTFDGEAQRRGGTQLIFQTRIVPLERSNLVLVFSASPRLRVKKVRWALSCKITYDPRQPDRRAHL